jgi:hypothetical protein
LPSREAGDVDAVAAKEPGGARRDTCGPPQITRIGPAAFIGCVIGGVSMIDGGIVEVLPGVRAENRQLEQVARPLTAVTTQSPGPKVHCSPGSTPAGRSSVAA